MKICLLILSIFSTINSFCIRGHSVIWRNSDNIIVKKVVFSEGTRLKPYFPNEKEELNNLEDGFIYHAEALEPLQKILIKKTKKI